MAASGSSTPAALGPAGVAAFISKVWSILTNEEYKTLISWSECGKNMIVHDYPSFSRDVLPRYFKHNNFNSFVRQLNLYGFRKVSHPEQGVLSKVQVSEPNEFWHPNFRRGHFELLHLVQRRPVASRVAPTEEKSSDLSKVLTDIHQMKGKQEDIGDMLEDMRQDNAHLKRELEVLRQKHTRQQRVLNKIIQFLIHMVYKGGLPSSGRRRHESSKYLMLTDAEGVAPPAKRGRVTIDPSPPPFTFADTFPEFSNLPIEAPPEVAPIDPAPPLPLPTITSPPLSPSMTPLVQNTDYQYLLEPTIPSVSHATATSPHTSTSTPTSTNAMATIATSPPLPSSSSSSSTLLPALTSSLNTADSAAALPPSEYGLPTVYPNWTNLTGHLDSLTGHLDSHQQQLDSLPDFLSNQLSFDSAVLNQFITFEDAPDYDAIDTARLLEALSEDDERDLAISGEVSPQTALVPFANSEAMLPTAVFPSQTQPLTEEDEQSSSLRELLELNRDTDT